MIARFITGDAIAHMAMLEPASFDCIMVDPPYAQTGLAWDRRVHGWPALARRLLKPTGSMWVFGSLKSFMAMAGQFDGWRFAQDVVWEKQNGSGFMADRFRRVHEQVAHFYRDDAPWSGVYRDPQVTLDAKARSVRAGANRAAHAGGIAATLYESVAGGPRLMRSVLQVRNCHRQGIGHATPKPEGLIEPLLRYATPPGGRVLDPFAGSGTTGVVAQRLGFQCTLIESDPTTAALAQGRLAA